MKKLFFIFALLITTNLNVRAEIYHGIDINAVYSNSDWSRREKIKEIIDDYTLLLQYQEELSLCSQNTENLPCLDKLAENIIKHFYAGDVEANLKSYHDYVKATFNAYGFIHCLNKYKIPAGTMCNQENYANTQKLIEQYIKELLQPIEQILTEYTFIANYK